MTSRKPVNSMWADALSLLDEADRLHRQFFQLGPGAARGPSWEPPVDVFETGNRISILIALPGVAPDQVEVVIEGAVLLVVGERRLAAMRGAHIHRMEIPYGRFERRIGLPPGRFEIGESTLAHGCLHLSLLRLP